MNETFKADLHCHSNLSDGTCSPKELLDLAKSIGLSGLAITDHDTVEAYSSILPYANEIGVQLISGVEFSATFRSKSVHILGYAFSLKNEALLDFCKQHQERRKLRNLAILQRLKSNGIAISYEELLDIAEQSSAHNKTIGRPHIALALLKKGVVETIQEAFRHYIGEGKVCYVQGNEFSIEETINVIHNAHGYAVVAHPHLLKGERFIKELLNKKFDGLEGYYCLQSPAQNARWIKEGLSRNWLITGGSDFHGSIKPQISLGCSTVGKELFDKLYSRFKENI